MNEPIRGGQCRTAKIKATIPRVPMTLNRLLRSHWTVRRMERHAWYLLVYNSIRHGPWNRLLLQRGAAPPKKRMEIKIVVTRTRPQDPDNAMGSVKPVLDALNRLGWIVDDSPRWLDLQFSEVRGKKEQTEITIAESREAAETKGAIP